MNIDFYGLFNYGDEDGVKIFALAHQLTHDAESAAFAAQGIQVGDYEVGSQEVVQPWINAMRNPEEPQDPGLWLWLQMHNQAHQQMLANLPIAQSIGGVDLSMVDFRDPDQMYQWLTMHQQIHDYEQQQLGISGT